MGYQESMIEVGSLAEASGIRRAVVEHEERGWLGYYATETSIRDILLGDPAGLIPARECARVMPRGRLLVIVGGRRHPYQHCDGRWTFIDAAAEVTRENYLEHFAVVGESAVRRAWRDDQATARRAYRVWTEYLDEADKPGGVVAPAILREVVHGMEATAHEGRSRDLARHAGSPSALPGLAQPA